MKRIIPGLAATLVAGFVCAQPQIDARSYYLVDASSGVVLAEDNSALSLDPASLTKLMTAYVVFEALESTEVSLEDAVPVSEKAWRQPGSRMFIEVGSEVKLDDLLRGLIVQSGNDAAIALAEHIAGSEQNFVDRMNRAAERLGMTGTDYKNPNGLPARGHVSTAADMGRLAQALIGEFPEHYSRYSQREFTYNSIRQHNRNALLWLDDSVDGLKTGYTRAAGYCLVSSAERDGMRLISVVFGSSTPDLRTEGSMALLDYGFDAYETHKLFAVGEPIAQARVWKGNLDLLALGATEDIFVTVPRGEYSNLGASAALTADLVAPLERFQAVGEIEITLGEERLYRYPLVALEAVSEGWFLSRVTDSISLMFGQD